MTTNELRAKFEAWAKNQRLPIRKGNLDVEYALMKTDLAWASWQAAHASRDAEVEALRKDAERYRWIRNTDYEDLDETLVSGVSVDFSVSMRQGDDLDKSIDDAMREESK